MADVESVTIVLPEEMADRIRATVTSGEYASASEAIVDAVALWSAQRDAFQTRDIDRLRRAWDGGMASGGFEPYDMKDILAEARSRLDAASRG